MDSTRPQSSHSPSYYLPDTLFSLILEYLPLTDYPNVSLTSQRLNKLVKESFMTWSRCIFSKYIDPSAENNIKSLSLASPYSKVVPALYEDKTDPKQIIKIHCDIKGEWADFLKIYFLDQQKDILLKEIYTVFRNPPPPFPKLKRDTMCFSTNSLFQNFLTEVYFQLNKSSCRKDQMIVLIEELVKKVALNCSKSSSADDGNSLSLQIITQSDELMKLCGLIYLLGQNHCQMVRSYISNVKESLPFLKQYIKLWRSFVLIIIDLDEAFSSLSKFSKGSEKQAFMNSPDPSEFSLWKIFVDIWRREVFEPMSTCLAKIINSLFVNIRNNQEDKALEETIVPSISMKEEEIEDTILLIQETYQAISDLSYDEYNIFFWECKSICSKTPKGFVDFHIMESISAIYKQVDLFSTSQIKDLSLFFANDVKLIKTIFGKKLSHSIIQLQFSFLQNALKNVFDFSLLRMKQENYLNGVENSQDFYIPLCIDVNKALNLLETTDTKIRDQIHQHRTLQRRFAEVILRECPSFGDYLSMLDSLDEKLKVQKIKFSEQRARLLKRGFTITEGTSEESSISAKRIRIPA